MTIENGDNRIRLDETPVDFTVSDYVDQLHSKYPSPNTQARYDYMRTYLIGLLSNQSSDEEPFEKRIGTLWLNKKLMQLLLYDGEKFDAFAKFISVETEENEVISLQSLIDDIRGLLSFVGPAVVWSGIFTEDEVNEIPIPEEYRIYSEIVGMQAFVWINGLLIDPRSTTIDPQNNTKIDLIGVNPEPRQRFTVKLEKITSIKEETVPA